MKTRYLINKAKENWDQLAALSLAGIGGGWAGYLIYCGSDKEHPYVSTLLGLGAAGATYIAALGHLREGELEEKVNIEDNVKNESK